ncbi:MAG: MotA/TolQ/ExbB proton channel family protein [Kiritimatiellia bacterium]
MEFVENLFERGGPVMWALLLCSLTSLTIVIERLIFWTREERKRKSGKVKRIFELTEEGKYDEAADTAGNGGSDFRAGVLAAGLRERKHGLSEAMQVEATNRVCRMKCGLAVLDTVITMAPLLGILGTVMGIIQSFDLLGASGIEDPRAVTGGIAQALITTATGLVVALVTLMFYNYFVSKTRKEAMELEQIATQFEVAYRKSKCK